MVTLDLTYLQSNDATVLQLTDAAGTYHVVDNPGGWETGGATNPDVADIVAEADTTLGKHHLYLDVIVTDSSDTDTTYDQINLYDHDSTGPFATAADLVWEFDAANFVSGGVAMGTDEDELVNGVYDITLSLLDASTGVAVTTALNEKILVDGKVRIKVYTALRNIPEVYDDLDENYPTQLKEFDDMLKALFKYGLFRGMLANISNATQSEVINTLEALERLTVNDT